MDEAASRLAAAELGADTSPSAAAARERAAKVEAVALELDAPVPHEARFDANLAAAPPPPPPPPQLPPPDERAIVETFCARSRHAMTSCDITWNYVESLTSSDLLCQENASAAAERERRRECASRWSARPVR